jgi:NarL family two-component system response regulator LiaR
MLRRGGIAVTAVATSPDALLRLSKLTRPAVVIIDARSGGHWVQTVPRLTTIRPPVAVIALTGHDSAALPSQILRLGGSSVLSMRATQDDVLRAVHSAIGGYGYIETGLLAGVLSDRDRRREHLTVLELDILRCLAEGLSNQQIAARLKYKPGTVKNYVHNIFEKLEASDRTQAVVNAFRVGMID